MREVIIFATYYKQLEKCQTLIHSLKMQTNPNWKLIICSNGDASANDIVLDDERISVTITPTNTEFWGALNRKDYIENGLPDGVMLINTSVEDYYAPTLIQEVIECGEKADFVHWDFSHHIFGYQTMYAITQPRISKMDWGSYSIRSEVAKKVVLADDMWKQYVADGIFVEELIKQVPNLKFIRIPKILMTKN
jgi:hypothetical protein